MTTMNTNNKQKESHEIGEYYDNLKLHSIKKYIGQECISSKELSEQGRYFTDQVQRF